MPPVQAGFADRPDGRPSAPSVAVESAENRSAKEKRVPALSGGDPFESC